MFMHSDWPHCSAYEIVKCEGCEQKIEDFQVCNFQWKNRHGELNPSWSFTNRGYYYENEAGDCYLKEGNGTTHFNIRNGRFICQAPGGVRQFYYVPDYKHAIVKVGDAFIVENGRRVYPEKSQAPDVRAAAKSDIDEDSDLETDDEEYEAEAAVFQAIVQMAMLRLQEVRQKQMMKSKSLEKKQREKLRKLSL